MFLEQQIKILQSTDSKRSKDFKQVVGRAFATVDILMKVERQNAVLRNELTSALERFTAEAAHSQKKLTQVDQKLKESRKLIARLKSTYKMAINSKENAVKRAVEEVHRKHTVHHLLHKSIYTEKTRNLIHLLVQAGCSRESVHDVIYATLKSAGIVAKGNISRRTVSRVVLEGYYAAQVQLGYEMGDTLGMTFSADGTMHRSINYNTRHVNYKVESQPADGNITTEHKTCFLGICAPLDGSSEQSIKSWKELLGGISDVYNQSPLAKQRGNLLQVIDIFVKLNGMMSDHCAKEKKDAQLLQQEKLLATYQSLGEDEMLNKSNQELLPSFMEARRKMIDAAGGDGKWSKLPQSVQSEREAVMMEKQVIELGKAAFELLSADEKHILKLFIWAGCGCHKDLNTVRGGNSRMMAWWGENNIPGPVLLANRDNAAALKDYAPESDTVTAAQEQALERVTCGGVKAAKLAGDIFNNKNDKKGHHDTFHWWWKANVQENLTFPDTSNNRF